MVNFRFLRRILFFALSLCMFIQAHDGHHTKFPPSGEPDFFISQNVILIASWLEGIGRFHLLFLHFPIALITMTVVAEWLWIWFANPLFSHAARFMILSAAIFALPTALLGQAFGYAQNYEGFALDLYLWHRYFGFLTAGLAIVTAILRERYIREYSFSLTSYYLSLFFLFLCISLTGTFGGSLAFGLAIW